MLKKINAGGVESDDGFKIQITGPETLKYICGNFEVAFSIDYDKFNKKINVYVSEVFTWDKYTGTRDIDEVTKVKITRDIKDAVKLLDGDFEII